MAKLPALLLNNILGLPRLVAWVPAYVSLWKLTKCISGLDPRFPVVFVGGTAPVVLLLMYNPLGASTVVNTPPVPYPVVGKVTLLLLVTRAIPRIRTPVWAPVTLIVVLLRVRSGLALTTLLSVNPPPTAATLAMAALSLLSSDKRAAVSTLSAWLTTLTALLTVLA